MKNFALIGASGYIAPRHMEAIGSVGGNLVAAVDPSDSVGVIDRYFPDASFFTEFELFDRHIELQRRQGRKIDFVTVCSPNYLHDAHVRFTLRSDADAICEKPLVLNPRNVNALQEEEQRSGRKINTILQLRLHQSIIDLRDRIAADKSGKIHDVNLHYVTSRGRWYYASWKGVEAKSGGIATNIGVHFFDMLSFVFGKYKANITHHREIDCAAGYMELERARVRWFLSINRRDLPASVAGKQTTYRSITVDGSEFEFSDGFTELHKQSYKAIVAGRGFTVADIAPSIDAVARIRTAPIELGKGEQHPYLATVLSQRREYLNGWPV